MADQTTDQAAPTEVQQHSMQEAADKAAGHWQGDFTDEQLTIPYKREASNEKDEDEDDTSSSDTEATSEDTESKVTEEIADPEPVITITDPGEYKAADYSFEVTDKNGKTVKIATPDDAEKFAEDDENFQTAKDLRYFLSKSQKMERDLERDYEKWDSQRQTFAQQVETEAQRRETVTSYEAEFEYLAGKGLIPKLSAELKAADWRDPEVASNDDVKVYNDILNYLVEENKIRVTARVKPLTSIIDAYNAWKLDTNRQKTEAARKAAADQRKTAGAKVAGVSPSQQGSSAPKGIAVGRSDVFKRGQAIWDN